uniref:Capsid protein n=1 Tax=Mulberry mosaic dwarf associated virus TaxID=1631303 RepID=A0A6G7SKB5_9GEMI|nr:putative coat protein [Mulberry mosaic dwarf associated virus]
MAITRSSALRSRRGWNPGTIPRRPRTARATRVASVMRTPWRRRGPRSSLARRKRRPINALGPVKRGTFGIKLASINHTGGNGNHLTHFDHGDDTNQRTGRKIKINGINIRGKLYLNNPRTNSYHIVRLWIIRDTRPGSEPVSFSSFMDMHDNEPMTAMVKKDWGERFQVLKDLTFHLVGANGLSFNEDVVEEYFKFKGYVLYNHEDSGSLANVLENGIFLYAATSHPSENVTLTANCRVYFYDAE